MNFFRFGFIDFFGILAPGVIFLINISIFLYAILGLSEDGIRIINALQESKILLVFIEKGSGGFVLTLLLFIICYLSGFILRLVRPDIVDKSASIFVKILSPQKLIYNKYKLMFELERDGILKTRVNGKDKESKKLSLRKRIKQFNKYLQQDYYSELIDSGKEIPAFFWPDEKYPYYKGSLYIYKRFLPPKLYEILMQNEKYHNTNTYNYWKMLLTARDQNLSSMIFQAEAYIRFMCGSFWALFVGVLSGILLSATNLINPHTGVEIKTTFGLFFTAVSVLMLGILLRRYKNQRRREVKMILDAVIITSNGKKESDFFFLELNQLKNEDTFDAQKA